MAPNKIRAIIFDIGRVLVRLDIAGAMRGLATSASLSPEDTWAAIEHDPQWRDWQEGRMSPRDWQLHICRRLGVELTFEQFTEVWNRVLDSHPLIDSALLEYLSKHYRLAVLSNTDPLHVAELEKRFDLFRFFPRRIYSCTVGTSKPSPLIFREALRACKVTAEAALYKQRHDDRCQPQPPLPPLRPPETHPRRIRRVPATDVPVAPS